MNKREMTLAIAVAVIIGGWALMSWVIKPALAAYAEVKEETSQLEEDLASAQAMVDSESTIRRRWYKYERAGLMRSAIEAEAETSGVLFAWAKDAGFEKVALSNEKPKTDDTLPFGVMSYTLQTRGQLSEIFELLWMIRRSPYPMRLEKCVINSSSGEGEDMQLSLAVSTLFTPEAKAQ